MPDPVMFGRLPKRTDPRTLSLARFIPKPVAVPPEVHWAAKVPKWGPMLNHTFGDCIEASIGHQIQVITHNNGHYNCPPDGQILDFYAAVLGVPPADVVAPGPGSDMLTPLNYWQSTGVGVNKHKITGYAEIYMWVRNDAAIRQAIYQFGGIQYGFDCPQSAVDQYHAGEPWTITPGTPSPIVGGHCVPLVGYDANWVYTVSWGVQKKMSYDFLAQYGAEAYTVTTNEWNVLGEFDAAGYAAAVAAAKA